MKDLPFGHVIPENATQIPDDLEKIIDDEFLWEPCVERTRNRIKSRLDYYLFPLGYESVVWMNKEVGAMGAYRIPLEEK